MGNLTVGGSTLEKLHISMDPRFERTLEAFFRSFASELTKKTYLAATREFLGLAFQDISQVGELRRDHLLLYQSWLKERGQAKKTILTKLSAVSSLCQHLAHEGFVERNLAYGLKRPKSDNRKETADFTDEEVRRLFAALDPKSFAYTSHRALLAIGFYAGLRSREIRHLKVGNIGEVRGHRVLSLTIKGDRPHEIPLTPFAYRCIEEHLVRLSELGVDVTDPEQWIFPSLRPFRNKPISGQALEKILQWLIERAGVECSPFRVYSPHSMRATFAGHLLNKVEAPLEQVQRAMGHASPTTTMRYNKREADHDRSPVYRIDY